MDEWIKWDAKLSVGVDFIDEQHKELVNLINLLGRSIFIHRERSAQDFATQKLLEYTLFHFSTEEDLFKKYNFPQSEEHKKEHSAFIKKVSAFKKDFDNEKHGLAEEIIAYLKFWLVHHILEIDHQYAEFFKKNNLNPRLP